MCEPSLETSHMLRTSITDQRNLQEVSIEGSHVSNWLTD
jgi:hypothetical protein